MIWTDIINLENKITWISPKTWLGRKVAHIKHTFYTSDDGFIIRPSYMDIHLSYVLQNVIGRLQTSLHQLEIEVGRCARIPLEERIANCVIKEWNMKNTMFFYEIRGRYYCLFQQGFGPLCKVMKYEDQQCLGLFLLELKRHKEKLLKNSNTTAQTHNQRTITTFFGPITPTHATSLSRTT